MSNSVRIATSFLIIGICYGGLFGAEATKPKKAQKVFPDPKLPQELVISPTAEVKTYKPTTPGNLPDSSFAVYVPKSYSHETPMPLVVSSHGINGTGPGEITGWVKFAEEYGFIVVCPTYALATQPNMLKSKSAVLQEEKMLLEIMERVFRSLNVDRELVLHTGFSGGGLPTYFYAMRHPEIFTALCFRSANFLGDRFPMDVRPWRNRPIYIFWGSKDHPLIIEKGNMGRPPEGPLCLAFFQKAGCTRLKHQIIEGGGHESRPDLAAKWFAEEVIQPVLQARQQKLAPEQKPSPKGKIRSTPNGG
ncbi:MAG: hypothetical protein NZ602_05965 [Thermoguttaceae bacterium]|nr:hypothetical protein [Thermoguttaceae bacterium]MDW8038590.1 hypothetical protein [Thermoguttaceae bacterium]